MTIPTYTLSDLEALRERCAKVADDRGVDLKERADLVYQSGHANNLAGIITARSTEAQACAKHIRALQITPKTEEEKKP